MTDIKTLNARRKLLEADQEKQPERDFTPEWTELGRLYLEAGSKAHHDYCQMKIKAFLVKSGVIVEPQPPATQDDASGHHETWQERLDMQ